jgi:hypothetical protein
MREVLAAIVPASRKANPIAVNRASSTRRPNRVDPIAQLEQCESEPHPQASLGSGTEALATAI